MKRLLLLLAFALPAHAQVQTSPVSPAAEVQRLAPQLLAFAGGEVNFANLVNGLALGVPVTLTTPVATGGLQAFTFTPTGTLTSAQIAQVLETARQSLIARGIATPTAQQLGAALTGGALTTAPAAAGSTAPSGQSPATAIQNATSAPVTTVRNTSDSPLPRGVSDTPPLPVPGVTSPLNTTTPEAPSLATPPAASTVAPTVAPTLRSGDR